MTTSTERLDYIPQATRPNKLLHDADSRHCHREDSETECGRLVGQQTAGRYPDRYEIGRKPLGGAPLGNKILHAGRGHAPHRRTIGSEPSEKSDDLVELGEDEPRKPAESDQASGQRNREANRVHKWDAAAVWPVSSNAASGRSFRV